MYITCQSTTLSSNDFGCTEVDVLDDTVVIKENVYVLLVACIVQPGGLVLTFWFDVSMSNAALV